MLIDQFPFPRGMDHKSIADMELSGLTTEQRSQLMSRAWWLRDYAQALLDASDEALVKLLEE